MAIWTLQLTCNTSGSSNKFDSYAWDKDGQGQGTTIPQASQASDKVKVQITDSGASPAGTMTGYLITSPTATSQAIVTPFTDSNVGGGNPACILTGSAQKTGAGVYAWGPFSLFQQGHFELTFVGVSGTRQFEIDPEMDVGT